METRPPRSIRRFATVGAALSGLFLPGAAFAATAYWTGAINDTWDTSAQNWSSDSAGQKPVAFTGTSDVIFSASPVKGASNIAVSENTASGNLSVNAGETVKISPPSPLSIPVLGTGNVTVAVGSRLTVTGIYWKGLGSKINITGVLDVNQGSATGGDAGYFGNGGVYTIAGGGTLNVSVFQGTLAIKGGGTTVNITGSTLNGATSGKLKSPSVGVGTTLNIGSSLSQTSSTISLNGTLNIANGASLTDANGLTGNGTLNGSGSGASLGIVTTVSTAFYGGITGTLALKTSGTNSDGSFTFAGADTASGGITVGAGSAFILGSTGSITFHIGANGAVNGISGAGSATYDGVFILDLSGADLTPGNSWTLAKVAAQSFSGSFSLKGFTNHNGIWTDNGNAGLTFNQATGVLAIVASGIPEPAAYGSALKT